ALFAYGAAIRLLLNHRVSGGQSALDARVPRMLDELERSPLARAKPGVDVLRGRLAYLAGNMPRAIELYTRACEAPANSVLDAERARYALGIVVGGERGRELQAQAEHTLQERGVINPAGCVKTSFPELFLPR